MPPFPCDPATVLCGVLFLLRPIESHPGIRSARPASDASLEALHFQAPHALQNPEPSMTLTGSAKIRDRVKIAGPVFSMSRNSSCGRARSPSAGAWSVLSCRARTAPRPTTGGRGASDQRGTERLIECLGGIGSVPQLPGPRKLPIEGPLADPQQGRNPSPITPVVLKQPLDVVRLLLMQARWGERGRF